MRRRRRSQPGPFWTRLKNRAVLTLLIALISGLAWLLDASRPTMANSVADSSGLSPRRVIPLETISFATRWSVEAIFAESPIPDVRAISRGSTIGLKGETVSVRAPGSGERKRVPQASHRGSTK